MAGNREKVRQGLRKSKMSVRDRVIVRESGRGRGWSEIARKSENEYEGPSDSAREREGPCDGHK